MCFKPKHTKFQRFNARDTFSNLQLNVRRVGKMCILTENWPYLGNGEI